MTVNEPTIRFKVVIPHEWKNQEKGKFWEEISADLFKQNDWTVTQNIEFDGMQTDIYVKNLDTNETGLIECKFQEDSIDAPTIYKLMGKALYKKVDYAYLLSTSALNANAKGIVLEYENEQNKPFSLVSWSSHQLAEVFMRSYNIKRPDMGKISGRCETITLLVTHEKKIFWVAEEIGNSHSRNCAIIFPTQKSNRCLSSEEWKEYFASDKEWKNLEFTVFNPTVIEPKNKLINQSISEKRVTISNINQADSFDDYHRPSRPEDFFGRKTHQHKFWEFVKKVRDNSTDLRVVSFSGNTGLGKSSLVLKLASECGSKSENEDKRNVYIYHIDVTSVNQTNADLFVSAAITKALEGAIDSRFVQIPNHLVSINPESPFDSESIKLFIENLENIDKVIVIFFDQFEEILTKDALSSLYGLFEEAAYKIDSLKRNIILGFCWRTDIDFPPEHPASSTWKKLQERLKNINLAEFSESESLELLDGFKEYVTTKKDQELEIITKASSLRDNLSSQPWFNQPWYLKRECGELYNQDIDRSKLDPDHNKVIAKSDIETSFNKDIQGAIIIPGDDKCLKYIAKFSPVSKMDVCSKFDGDVINSLLKSKLVIETGQNYKIYWDMFREYLLDGKLPEMIISYRFRTKISTVLKIFRWLNKCETISDLVRVSNYAESTVKNALQDLQNFFEVTKDKESGKIIASEIFLQLKDEEIAEKLAEQIEAHVVIKKIYEKLKPGEWMWLAEVQNLLSDEENLTPTTATDYASKMLSWFHFAGLLEVSKGRIVRPTHPKQGKQKGKPLDCEPPYDPQPKSNVVPGQLPFFDTSIYHSRLDH